MKLSMSTAIAAPPEVVWSYLDDSEKIKLWMKGVEEDEPTSEGPTRVGSTFRMKIREGKKLVDYDGTITAYDRPRHMALDMVGGCAKQKMTMHVDYRLAESGPGRTRLDYLCVPRDVPAIWRAFGVLFTPLVKLQLKSFMKTLKRLAEDEARGVVGA